MKFSHELLFVLFIIIKTATSQDDVEERVQVELQLADFDLADAYDEISEATKKAFLGHGFDDKVLLEQDRAILMRLQAENNREFESDVPYDLERNWTLLTKTGDVLLPENDYKTLVFFHNANEELSRQAKVPCLNSNSTSNCTITKQDFLDILATNRNSSYLNETWSAWQENLEANKPQFGPTLQLVNKAFLANEQHNARSYWEMLSEYPEGYTKAQVLWEEVQPLYKKLHEFVKVRLEQYYNITTQNDSTIPVYLLGSEFGTDWSNIADIVLPHPYLYDEVVTELKYRNVKEVYQLAESATKTIGFGNLGKPFWNKSNFNYSSCGPHIFSYCGQQYTELITCQKLGWSEYLDIHEATMNVALRNREFISLPRQEVRFSAVDEALEGLGSLIAVNNLPVYDFIPKNAFKDETDTYVRKNTALLLIALRFLPKIPYYLLADTWRLEELEFSYNNLTEKWWEKRNEMQGVRGNTNLEVDFLGDSFVTSNKPHLSEFFGVFLQFQIMDYYKRFFSNENGTLANFIQNDQNFIEIVNDRPNKNWLNLISYHFGFDEVSSAPLLEYFKPLEEYLDKAPLKQIKIDTTPKPRTTKATTKPTPKRKITKKVPKLTLANLTIPFFQNNQTQKKEVVKRVKVEAPIDSVSEAPVTESASSEKLYVLLGIAGGVCAGFLILIIVRRIKKKRRNNNRRFET